MALIQYDLFDSRPSKVIPPSTPLVAKAPHLPPIEPDVRLVGYMLTSLASLARPESRTSLLQQMVGARYFEGRASVNGDQHYLCQIFDAAVDVLAKKFACGRVTSFAVPDLLAVMNQAPHNGRFALIPSQVLANLEDAARRGLVDELLALGNLHTDEKHSAPREWTLRSRALASIYFDLTTMRSQAERRGVSLQVLSDSPDPVHAYMAALLTRLDERGLGERIGSIAQRRALFALPDGETRQQVNGAHGAAYFMALHGRPLRESSAERLAATELEKRGMLIRVEGEFLPRMSSLCAVLADLCEKNFPQ